MSSSAGVGLLLLLLAGLVGPMADGSTIGAAAACATRSGGAIVVCGRALRLAPRLPLPDERAAVGEVTRSASDGARGDAGPPREPNRLLQTIVRIVRKANGAVTGTDLD